jgi:hypothetical protein
MGLVIKNDGFRRAVGRGYTLRRSITSVFSSVSFTSHRALLTERRIYMPDFGSPFSGLANDRKLTDEELVRAIRFMVVAEYEAIQLYMQLAESTDNMLAVDVLKDIADEERVHVGEFLRLLREVAPDEEKFYAEGAEEVDVIVKKMKKKSKKMK